MRTTLLFFYHLKIVEKNPFSNIDKIILTSFIRYNLYFFYISFLKLIRKTVQYVYNKSIKNHHVRGKTLG
jgi:hypothetical protein